MISSIILVLALLVVVAHVHENWPSYVHLYGKDDK